MSFVLLDRQRRLLRREDDTGKEGDTETEEEKTAEGTILGRNDLMMGNFATGYVFNSRYLNKAETEEIYYKFHGMDKFAQRRGSSYWKNWA
jgi:hypothetical protein